MSETETSLWTRGIRPAVAGISLVFFLSGFAALLYEMIWQRSLLTIIGATVESATLVVCVFLLGLGAGAILGGRISAGNAPALLLIASFELVNAVFGVFSLQIFSAIDSHVRFVDSTLIQFLISLAILPPTLLMGSTLPLGVSYLVRNARGVGYSTGTLYFINTLGSACAAFFAGLVGFHYLGLTGCARVAAIANSVAALVAGLLWARSRRAQAQEYVGTPLEQTLARPTLSRAAAIIASAASGFTAIGYEILWLRGWNFFSAGDPRVFPFLAGAFLAGIAFGALLLTRMFAGRRWRSYESIAGGWFAAASISGYLCVPILAHLLMPWQWASLWTVAATGFAFGCLFPLLCEASVVSGKGTGQRVAELYFANIAGTFAAGLATGYLALDKFTLAQTHAFVLLVGLVGTAALLSGHRRRRVLVPITVAVAVLMFLAGQQAWSAIYERLQMKAEFQDENRFTDVVETRAGVVTVDDDQMVSGDGAYDGYIDTDIHSTNTVLRPLSLSLLHPSPRQVLIIGIAGGAWTAVTVSNPRVESVTAIEINPGYLQVIARYPEVSWILSDSRVHIQIADARRWLNANPERTFDVIFMDTTYHWRNHSSNLLSREFLRLAHKHLRPGGLMYYNTTHSWSAQRTGVEEFPFALRFGPFLALSDVPIAMDVERWRKVLTEYRIQGHPVFDLVNREDRAILDKFLALPSILDSAEYDRPGFETGGHIRQRTRSSPVITDDNMSCEWEGH